MKIGFQLLLIATILTATACASTKLKNEETTLYLVRHAEKADDSKDPVLSPKGKKRAVALATMLTSRDLDKVYSSDYIRTRDTAKPSAHAADLTVEIYDPRDHTTLINQLKTATGQTLLIVGHSNSTPSLVNQILGSETYPSLEHEEYDKMFIVKCDKEWKCTSSITSYN